MVQDTDIVRTCLHLLQAFSMAISRTLVQSIDSISTDAKCRVVPLRQMSLLWDKVVSTLTWMPAASDHRNLCTLSTLNAFSTAGRGHPGKSAVTVINN